MSLNNDELHKKFSDLSHWKKYLIIEVDMKIIMYANKYDAR